MIAALLLLLAAQTEAPIAIHLGELGDLELREAQPLTEALAAAIQKRTGRRTVVDDPAWPCDTPDRCRAEDLVFARMFGGPTKVHVLLERADKKAELFIPRGEAPDFAPAAAALFPEPADARLDLATATANPTTAGPEPEPSTFARVAPWLAIGTGALAAGAGAAFAAANASHREELRSGPHAAAVYEDLDARAHRDGIAAGILFGAAAAAVTTGVLLLILD